MEKETVYFIAIESEDDTEVLQKLSELGEYVKLVPGFYLLASKEPKGKILFSLNLLNVGSLKRFFLVESNSVIWNIYNDERDDRIRGILDRVS